MVGAWAEAEEPPGAVPDKAAAEAAGRLHAAALVLTAALDEAGFFAAAACAAMAADRVRQAKRDLAGAGGGSRAGAGGGGAAEVGVELEFEIDERGRVWVICEGDCRVLGGREEVCALMLRFVEGAGAGRGAGAGAVGTGTVR